jgi:hypothetical protein
VHDHLLALSRLSASVGANVAAGQTELVRAKLGHEPLARAVAADDGAPLHDG